MTKHRNPIQFAKTLFSLVLVMISVAAPVVAQTYVCPMAKTASEAGSSCCAMAALAAPSQPGEPTWSRSCDCPRITWDHNVTDQTRSPAASGVWEASGWLIPSLPSLSIASQKARTDRLPALFSGPPKSLWLEHQSIRC